MRRPFWGALQSLAEPHVRATAITMFSAGTALIGQGLGPVVVGALSDLMAKTEGGASLQASLVAITCLAFWPLLHAWRVFRLYEADRMRMPE